jgi:hypothetical protein
MALLGKIARMAKQDDFIKTALRLPRGLRDEIKAAADAAGHSMNDEIIDRIRLGPEQVAATAILAKISEFDAALRDAAKKQGDALWRVIERAETVCDQADQMLAAGREPEEEASLRREVSFLRELIELVKLHK